MTEDSTVQLERGTSFKDLFLAFPYLVLVTDVIEFNQVAHIFNTAKVHVVHVVDESDQSLESSWAAFLNFNFLVLGLSFTLILTQQGLEDRTNSN